MTGFFACAQNIRTTVNTIPILLEQLAGQPWPAPATPRDPWVLKVGAEALIALVEDKDQVHLCSKPGFLAQADMRQAGLAWAHELQAAALPPGAARKFHIDRRNGALTLVESWPRGRLDKILFGERLILFAELSRRWRTGA
jgi:hypothetical protein